MERRSTSKWFTIRFQPYWAGSPMRKSASSITHRLPSSKSGSERWSSLSKFVWGHSTSKIWKLTCKCRMIRKQSLKKCVPSIRRPPSRILCTWSPCRMTLSMTAGLIFAGSNLTPGMNNPLGCSSYCLLAVVRKLCRTWTLILIRTKVHTLLIRIKGPFLRLWSKTDPSERSTSQTWLMTLQR